MLFVGAFLYLYPLTLRFRYENGHGELVWLPRICGGYAAPHRLAWPPKLLGLSRRPVGKRRLTRFSLRQARIRRLLSQTTVELLECRVQVGTADPFTSAMLAGAMLAALGGLGSQAATAVKSFPARPGLQVLPFAQGGLQGRAECIFHLRCGDIIADALIWGLEAQKGRKT